MRGRKQGKQRAQRAAVPREKQQESLSLWLLKAKGAEKGVDGVREMKQQADPQCPGTTHAGATGTGRRARTRSRPGRKQERTSPGGSRGPLD